MPESQAWKIETSVAVPMREGTILYADLYRPDGPHSIGFSGGGSLPFVCSLTSWRYYAMLGHQLP